MAHYQGEIMTANIGGGGSGGGIPEAPEDGKLYGRKGAGWEEVPPNLELKDVFRRGVPGTYTQGTDFDDLQKFLTENINNRFFEGDDDTAIVVPGAASNGADDVVIANVMARTGGLRIQHSSSLNNTGTALYVCNVAHRLTLTNLNATGAATVSRLTLENCPRVEIVYGHTFINVGQLAIRNSNVIMRSPNGAGYRSTDEIIIDRDSTLHVDNGTMLVADNLLTNHGTLILGGTAVLNGVMNGASTGTVIDNRPSRGLETYARRQGVITCPDESVRDVVVIDYPDYAAIPPSLRNHWTHYIVTNDPNDLAVPQTLNPHYSETETLTGATWADGKPIYRRAIKSTMGAEAVTGKETGVISGFGELVSMRGMMLTASGSSLQLPFNTVLANGTYWADCYVSQHGGVNVRHSSPGNVYANRPVTVVIEYTKA